MNAQVNVSVGQRVRGSALLHSRISRLNVSQGVAQRVGTVVDRDVRAVGGAGYQCVGMNGRYSSDLGSDQTSHSNVSHISSDQGSIGQGVRTSTGNNGSISRSQVGQGVSQRVGRFQCQASVVRCTIEHCLSVRDRNSSVYHRLRAEVCLSVDQGVRLRQLLICQSFSEREARGCRYTATATTSRWCSGCDSITCQ